MPRLQQLMKTGQFDPVLLVHFRVLMSLILMWFVADVFFECESGTSVFAQTIARYF